MMHALTSARERWERPTTRPRPRPPIRRRYSKLDEQLACFTAEDRIVGRLASRHGRVSAKCAATAIDLTLRLARQFLEAWPPMPDAVVYHAVDTDDVAWLGNQAELVGVGADIEQVMELQDELAHLPIDMAALASKNACQYLVHQWRVHHTVN
jgi:hypothetical protein